MEGKSIGFSILLLFIVLIVALIFVPPIVDTTYVTTTALNTSNEVNTSTEAEVWFYPSSDKTTHDTSAIIDVYNATGVPNGLLTLDTGYIVNASERGGVMLITTAGNNSEGSQNYQIYYSYYQEGLVKNSATANIMNLVPLFFVIAILAIGAGYAYMNFIKV